MGEVRWWFFFRVMDVGAKKEIEKRDCKFDSKGRIKFRETPEFPPKTAHGRPASFFQLELQFEERPGGIFFLFVFFFFFFFT